jgi:hypothetical protein
MLANDSIGATYFNFVSGHETGEEFKRMRVEFGNGETPDD